MVQGGKGLEGTSSWSTKFLNPTNYPEDFVDSKGAELELPYPWLHHDYPVIFWGFQRGSQKMLLISKGKNTIFKSLAPSLSQDQRGSGIKGVPRNIP